MKGVRNMSDCIFCKIIKGEIPWATIFENDEFDKIVSDWKKKDPIAAQLTEDPAFIKAVKQLTEVKLMGKLKGITDETETN